MEGAEQMNAICLKISKYGTVSIARKWRPAFEDAICCPHNVYPCSVNCPLFDLTINSEEDMTVTFHCGNATYKVAYLENEETE